MPESKVFNFSVNELTYFEFKFSGFIPEHYFCHVGRWANCAGMVW